MLKDLSLTQRCSASKVNTPPVGQIILFVDNTGNPIELSTLIGVGGLYIEIRTYT